MRIYTSEILETQFRNTNILDLVTPLCRELDFFIESDYFLQRLENNERTRGIALLRQFIEEFVTEDAYDEIYELDDDDIRDAYTQVTGTECDELDDNVWEIVSKHAVSKLQNNLNNFKHLCPTLWRQARILLRQDNDED